MPRKPSMKDKIFQVSYDKQKVNKTMLNLKKSFDEVKAAINGGKK